MSDPSRDEVLPEEQDGQHQRQGRGDDGRRRGRLWPALREIAMITVTALVISFVIKSFVAQAFWIPSGSMEDTLVYGDRVMVSKIQAGPMKVERGDIAVFEDPGSWLGPMPQKDRGPVVGAVLDVLEFVGVVPVAHGNHLIKRVIGVGGDHVACCDEEGRLTVNGEPLDEPYLYPGDDPSDIPFDITVPDDSIWVMGDHRSNSSDSRMHDDGTGATGSVPRDHVVGQAFVLLFPLDRITWFSIPQTFDDVPAAGST
ncbi:signal peptidase I [Ornithinimicrobium avium]|nr:signal peptidase I [Ornithinimicrobium avium]